MAYIGHSASGNFTTKPSKDTFSGDGSTTAFTLSEGATTNTVDVFVENVRQEPTTAYTVSGTTLTFTAAPGSGTNNIYVVNRGPLQLSATHPAAQALEASTGTFTGDLTIPSINGGQIGGRRNLIINGAAEVNQRSTGTVNNGETYGAVDRFKGFAAAGGTFTLAQSTDSPDGYNNSILATVTSADSSIASGDFYGIAQRIEGKNVYHLGFGSSAAKTITISFWVKSSVTGTFGGAIRNSDVNRSFNFSYTVNSANTWEHKTYTIAGDTSGTWLTDTGVGLRVSWSLGDGSSRLQAAGQWGAGNFAGVTGQTNLITTGSATLQLTGVQLEIGSVATEFEHRSYGEELALCQRYFSLNCVGTGRANSTTVIQAQLPTIVTMRASPSIAIVNGTNAAGDIGISARNLTGVSGTVDSQLNGVSVQLTCSTTNSGNIHEVYANRLSFDAEL